MANSMNERGIIFLIWKGGGRILTLKDISRVLNEVLRGKEEEKGENKIIK